jgi:hypothetical protein
VGVAFFVLMIWPSKSLSSPDQPDTRPAVAENVGVVNTVRWLTTSLTAR